MHRSNWADFNAIGCSVIIFAANACVIINVIMNSTHFNCIARAFGYAHIAINTGAIYAHDIIDAPIFIHLHTALLSLINIAC